MTNTSAKPGYPRSGSWSKVILEHLTRRLRASKVKSRIVSEDVSWFILGGKILWFLVFAFTTNTIARFCVRNICMNNALRIVTRLCASSYRCRTHDLDSLETHGMKTRHTTQSSYISCTLDTIDFVLLRRSSIELRLLSCMIFFFLESALTKRIKLVSKSIRRRREVDLSGWLIILLNFG